MMFGLQQNVSMMPQPSAASSVNFTSNFSQHHTRLPPPPQHPPPYDAFNDGLLATRMRKPVQRRVVDYTSAAVNYLQVRTWQRDERDRTVLQPTSSAVVDMLPPVAYTDNPSTSFAAKFVHTSINKNRCPIYRVVWTPTGRRLITGAQTGEFTLWNGQSFNFEMLLQAHERPVRSMVWSHNGNWMVTGDDGGTIKYWQTNMNNVKVNEFSHKESIRDISFSSTDLKFCSCSDDTTVKVWDFARCEEERSLIGHGWDVKCADWHPKKSLIASGGKDNVVKLWDAKSGRELCSFHGHKNMVLSVKWNQNGNWLLTSSKDQIIKLYDIRSMKEMESFHGHKKDVTALAWHPFNEEYFVSGSYDGSIFHWLVGHDSPQVEIINAHEGSLSDLAWHPTGYLLCSGSNDHSTKFWCRYRPGDLASDKYTGYNPGYGEHHPNFNHTISEFPPAAEAPLTPGPFAPGLYHNQGTIPGIGVAVPPSIGEGEHRPIIPGLMSSSGAPPLPPGPPPSHLVPGQKQNYQQFRPQQQPPQQQFQPHNQQQYQQQQQFQPQNQQQYQQQQQFQPQNQQQFHQQQQFQQQIGQMNTIQHPPNYNQMQPQSNFQMPLHQHMPQPPRGPLPQGQSHTMPSNTGPMPMQQNQTGMQGSANQMMSPLPQGHVMNLNQIHSGQPSPNISQNVGAFPIGMPNVQVGVQSFMFNRPQMGQMPQTPGGLNNFQLGMIGGGNMGLPPLPQPPLPPK